MTDNNQAQAAQAAQITANYDKFVDAKEYKFSFRTVKDKDSGIETKRPTVELLLPIPSIEGIIRILEEGGKQLDLLQSAVADVVAGHVRSMLSDDEKLTSENFPLGQATWEFIANLPETEKRGRGIPKETWEDFAADYIAVMPSATGKTAEQVALAAKLLLGKFQAVKTNKPVIEKLQEQLAIYANNAPMAEQFSDCIRFLDEKADSLLQADETALLDNL